MKSSGKTAFKTPTVSFQKSVWIDVKSSDPQKPAQYLRKVFNLKNKPSGAITFLSAPGWHEFYVNGQKVGDCELSPVVTQFNAHVGYIRYDIAKYLKQGDNAIAVLLGNGWYNCFTDCIWKFQTADWRSNPKLRFELWCDSESILSSDGSWRMHDSPLVFNALRNGEIYDARREIPDFANASLDDSKWEFVRATDYPPHAILQEETATPIRAVEAYESIGTTVLSSGAKVYDFGVNIAGWCEISVVGKKDAKVILDYCERVGEDGDINPKNTSGLVYSGAFQHDEFILAASNKPQNWHPRFTYHGFRYVRVTIEGEASIVNIRARFVHTDFKSVGSFESSSDVFNKLQECTRRSYLSNFVGYPTDCPHREKNGWTGDAMLAAETGLWNFDATESYLHFLQMVADSQAPDGALACYVPAGPHARYWGSGPAWDSVIFEIPWQLYRFCGDDRAIRRFYPVMKRYLEYLDDVSGNAPFAQIGLGDWAHANREHLAPVRLTNAIFQHLDSLRMAEFATILEYTDDMRYYAKKAHNIREAFRKEFKGKDGSWGNGEWTALAGAIYGGFCTELEARRTAGILAKKVRENGYKVDFGILGAKFVPRVLADWGYADDAFRMFTQPEQPGWAYPVVALGETTLWEDWHGESSRNHIMYGDLSAWAFEFLAGIIPSEEHPGFKHLTIAPKFVADLKYFKASHTTPYGEISVHWQRKDDGSIQICTSLPPKVTADFLFGENKFFNMTGQNTFTLKEDPEK